MKSSHTQGPWEYAKTSSEDDRYDIFQSSTAWTVARTVNNAHTKPREANAALIAAAPDLLEACQTMVDAWGSCECVQGHTPEHPCPWCQARAAIAKAEGK